MDFTLYGGREIKPVFKMMDLHVTDVLNGVNVMNNNFFLRRHIINTKDDYFYLGQLTLYGEYFSIAIFLNRPTLRELDNDQVLYKSSVWLHSEQYKLTREIYNFFDLLGDLGGVTEVIMIAFGFVLYSISEHSFYVTASQKLFFARTEDSTVFESSTKKSKYLSKDMYPKDSTTREIKELEKHRYISIRMCDNMMLYFANLMGPCCSKCIFPKRDKLVKMYDEG